MTACASGNHNPEKMKHCIKKPNDSVIRLVGLVLCAIFLVSLSACDDEQEYVSETVTRCSIDVTTSFSGIDSRAIFTEEQEKAGVKSYCFMLYNGTGLDAQLIKLIDIDLTKVVMPYYTELPQPAAGQKWFAVMLGNVTGSRLGDAAKVKTDTEAGSTLGTLANAHYDIDRQANVPESVSDLTWSGSLTMTSSSGNLEFVLNPNVAKVTVNITNNSSESSVTNVRVKNVPGKVRYLQNVIYRHQTDADADNNIESFDALTELEGLEYLKYDMEKLFMPAKTDAKTYNTTVSWYIPHNLRGNGYRGNGGQVGKDADTPNIPYGATYVEIDGVKDGFDNDFVTASYKIYPGINEYDANKVKKGYYATENFNVVADHRYTVDVNIADDGLTFTVDGDKNSEIIPDNISETTKIKCFPQSNCWFIHPKLQAENKVTVWELPIDRINEYWRDIAGNEDNTITADSEWIMEVIWQDQNARVIHFCDEYRNESSFSDTYHGFGLNPAYITLDETTLSASYKNSSRDPITDIYGNVLVGVRKPNETSYLWSWHLWVTDYCPDYAPTYTSGNSYSTGIDNQGYMRWNNATKTWEYTYGGMVQHLRDEDYYYCTAAIWNNNYGSVWNTGIYKNKWMMDRMLGAQSPNNGRTQTAQEGWGLYYQYGRKDPFPAWGTQIIKPDGTNYNNDDNSLNDIYLYDINGKTLTDAWSRSSAKASNLSQGILNPTVYYASVTGGWWYLNCNNNNPWYSPTATDKKGFSYATTGRKTLFDPCPPGWCIPKWEAFYPLSINNKDDDGSGYTDQTSGMTDAVTYVFLGPPTLSSATINPYGEFRHYVWFNYQNEEIYEEPVFPIQGYISQSAKGLRLPTENGMTEHKREIRGYMWTVNGGNADDAYRYGYGYGTSSIKKANSTDGYYSVEDQAYGTYVVGSFSKNSIGWGYWNIINRGFYRTKFSHARGQNIRCIQEPDLPNE